MRTDFDNFDLEAAAGEEVRGGLLGLAPAGARRRRRVGAAVRAGGGRQDPGSWSASGSAICAGTRRVPSSGCSGSCTAATRGAGGSGATSALIGLAVGAGVAALLVPQSGPDTRRRLVGEASEARKA